MWIDDLIKTISQQLQKATSTTHRYVHLDVFKSLPCLHCRSYGFISRCPLQCCNLRSSSGANPEVEEDLIEGPLDMEEDDTSLWRWGGKHRYHGGRRGGYNKHHYGGGRHGYSKHHYGHKKHHYGYNKHHYGGYKNKHHYDDWGYPPQSPWVASAM